MSLNSFKIQNGYTSNPYPPTPKVDNRMVLSCASCKYTLCTAYDTLISGPFYSEKRRTRYRPLPQASKRNQKLPYCYHRNTRVHFYSGTESGTQVTRRFTTKRKTPCTRLRFGSSFLKSHFEVPMHTRAGWAGVLMAWQSIFLKGKQAK